MAKKAGARRFVYASSCSVYGYTENELYDETKPVSSVYPYGISKLQGEQAVMNLADDNFSVIALRKGTASGYSPRMRLDDLAQFCGFRQHHPAIRSHAGHQRAAREVQAAINSAAGYLPANLPSRPRYRKINPADQPILLLTLESDVVPRPQLYDIASSVFAQRLAQVEGVGQVSVGGSSLPAVRVEVNPQPLSKYNVGLDQVGSFLQSANANRPKGSLANSEQEIPIYTTDQLFPRERLQGSGG